MGRADPGAALGTGHRPASRGCRAAGQRAGLLPMLAHGVHRRTAGCRHDTVLYYRFMLGDASQPHGRTRTLPAPEPARRPPAPGLCVLPAPSRVAAVWPTRGCWKRIVDLIAPSWATTLRSDRCLPSASRCHRPGAGQRPCRLPRRTARTHSAARASTLQAAHAAVPWLEPGRTMGAMKRNAGGAVAGRCRVRAAAARLACQAYYEHTLRRCRWPACNTRPAVAWTEQGEELRSAAITRLGAAWPAFAPAGPPIASAAAPRVRRGPARSLIDPGELQAAPCADPEHSLAGRRTEAQWLHVQLRAAGAPGNLILQTHHGGACACPVFHGGDQPHLGRMAGTVTSQDRERSPVLLRAQQIGGAVFLGGDLLRTGPTTRKLPRATPWRPSSSVPASR